MAPIRFDGRVAVVTGAGGGLGKEYALLLAERGAAVVVNDLGGSPNGEGSSISAADKVVQEIRSKGGKAVANYDSVENGAKIIQTAIDNFKRVDIVINNAGILRDRSFLNLSDHDWDLIHQVHLRGSFQVSRAAWKYFRDQKYGRIIMTSSTSGLLGNFGQANYSAAKSGLVGLSNTLSLEGAKYNIHCNVIVPVAASRLTNDLMPPDVLDLFKPQYVAPVVAWLCHEDCSENGTVITTAGGHASKFRLQKSAGTVFGNTLENVRDNWDKIVSMDNPEYPVSNQEFSFNIMEAIRKYLEESSTSNKAPTGNQTMDAARGHKFKPTSFSYTFKDAILYALGVGVSTTEEDHLTFLFELNENFSVLPTYGVIIAQNALSKSGVLTGEAPGLQIDLVKLLHGEQYLQLFKPLDPNGEVECQASVAEVLDKGSGALVVVNVDGFSNKEKILHAQFSLFIVGAGGFGGKRTSDVLVLPVDHPKRPADKSVQYKVSLDQAAVYRLSGDPNPLHIDPDFAAMAGFSKPILHGLCSYGIAARQVLKAYANNDVSKFKAIKARFSKPVYPGETLQTDMWREGNRIFVETKVLETGNVALAGAYVDLDGIADSSETKHAVVSNTQRSGLQSDALFNEMAKRLEEHPDVVKKVNALFLYKILKDGKPASSWTLDLRSSTKGGEIYQGEPRDAKAQCTLTLEDDDMIAIATQKLNPQKAFMSGKLKISGNIMLSQKLGLLMQENSKL